jgi:uncharacterized protein (TIGR00369 family)
MKVVKMQRNSISCIICGLDNPLGLKAKFYELEDGSVASLFTYRNEHQSYPTRTHGGMITALLDELMGRTLWIDQPDTYGVTTSLNVTFRRPLPFDTKVKARAFMTFNGSRGFTAKGEIYSMDDKLLAESTCKYLKMSPQLAFGDKSHFEDEMCYQPSAEFTEIEFPEITK